MDQCTSFLYMFSKLFFCRFLFNAAHYNLPPIHRKYKLMIISVLHWLVTGQVLGLHISIFGHIWGLYWLATQRLWANAKSLLSSTLVHRCTINPQGFNMNPCILNISVRACVLCRPMCVDVDIMFMVKTKVTMLKFIPCSPWNTEQPHSMACDIKTSKLFSSIYTFFSPLFTVINAKAQFPESNDCTQTLLSWDFVYIFYTRSTKRLSF